MFELNQVAVIYKYSGDHQDGVASEALPAPLRVNLYDNLEFGFGVPGVSLRFTVTQGGGFLKVGDELVTEAVVATDQNGFAEVRWQLGAAGTAQEVRCFLQGVIGSPIFFTATSAADPESLPLSLNEILPAGGTSANSTSTAIVNVQPRHRSGHDHEHVILRPGRGRRHPGSGDLRLHGWKSQSAITPTKPLNS